MNDIITIQNPNNENEQMVIYQEIDYDVDPRVEFDGNLGYMVLFHKGYNLPKDIDINSDDFDDWIDMYAYIEKTYKPIAMLSIRLYNHNGLHLYSELHRLIAPQGHEYFDSGKVGLIFTTQERLDELGLVKELDRQEIIKMLDEEVKEYNYYLNGEIYCARIDTKTYCEYCETETIKRGDCYGAIHYGLDSIIESLPYPYKEAYDNKDYGWHIY